MTSPAAGDETSVGKLHNGPRPTSYGSKLTKIPTVSLGSAWTRWGTGNRKKILTTSVLHFPREEQAASINTWHYLEDMDLSYCYRPPIHHLDHYATEPWHLNATGYCILFQNSCIVLYCIVMMGWSLLPNALRPFQDLLCSPEFRYY